MTARFSGPLLENRINNVSLSNWEIGESHKPRLLKRELESGPTDVLADATIKMSDLELLNNPERSKLIFCLVISKIYFQFAFRVVL